MPLFDMTDEAREIYGLRIKVGAMIGMLRTRHGNKDGYPRRYDDAKWTRVEGILDEALAKLFAAQEAADG